MGYRSEVGITIPNEEFKNLVSRAKAENNYAFEFIQRASIYRTDKFTTLHFQWVKWYEDYEDVQFIEDFIREVPYVFKRIGEDYDDIECHEGDITDYDIYDCVDIIRTLDVESAGEKITMDEGGDIHDGFKQEVA